MDVSTEESSNLLPTSQQDVQQTNEQRVRKDWKYYLVWFWRFCIFALVGSSSVKVTRKLLSLVHLTSNVISTTCCSKN